LGEDVEIWVRVAAVHAKVGSSSRLLRCASTQSPGVTCMWGLLALPAEPLRVGLLSASLSLAKPVFFPFPPRNVQSLPRWTHPHAQHNILPGPTRGLWPSTNRCQIKQGRCCLEQGDGNGEFAVVKSEHLFERKSNQPSLADCPCQGLVQRVMAANYWASTQRKNWTSTPEKLVEIRDQLDKQNAKVLEQWPYPDRRLMFVFLRDKLLQLGKRLQFRQQCVATAMVYLHRYFLSTPMQNVNLYLFVATAFYLASKTEESPHHIRLVAAEARQSWPEFVPGDVSRLGEMEFCLISEMRSQLIVWHPYRSLIALKENQDLKLTNDELGLAWSIINDSFMTDLPLTCPPHIIAVIAMFLAVIFLPAAKQAGTLRPLGHDAIANPDSTHFSSLGASGRQAISSSFNNVLGNLHMSNQMAAQSNANLNGKAPANQNQNQTQNESLAQQPLGKEKAMTLLKENERMANTIKFLVESGIDINQMIEGTQEMISLYDVWEQYNEKSIKDVVARCLKTRGLDG
jgi:cyclin-C